MFNIYNEAVTKCIKGSNSKKALLADFIINTMYAEFSDEKIVETVKKLTKIDCFHEALTIIQSHNNKRIIKQSIGIIIESISLSGNFSLFLELPLNTLMKEIALRHLQKKCIDDHFDLIRTISSNQYYEKAASLFLTIVPFEDRKNYTKNHISWSHALYCFSMNNQYYSSAAEAMYRYCCEIHDFLITLQENKHEFGLDILFLKEIMQDHLMLTILATRNINKVYEECWFLISSYQNTSKRKNSSSLKQESNTTIRELITLQSLEENIANSFSK